MTVVRLQVLNLMHMLTDLDDEHHVAVPLSSVPFGGTSYCVAADCDCKPAGVNTGYGALTGRARWAVIGKDRPVEWAAGTDITLCGGCKRRFASHLPVVKGSGRK